MSLNHQSWIRKCLMPSTVAVVLSLASVPACRAQGDEATYSGAKLIAPFASVSVPTGRFGESDQSKLKPGHKTGYSLGADAGLFISEFLAIGADFDYVRFNQDFSQFTSAPPTKSAKTVVPIGGLWVRLFLPGGYARWKPYGVGGAGFGRVKSDVSYSEPQPRQAVAADGTIEEISSIRDEITINTAFSIVGGIGVMVPVSPMIGFCIEPRYRSVSTKGTGLTVKLTSEDGQTYESQFGTSDTGGITRLKSKSSTGWWEIRGGLVITVR